MTRSVSSTWSPGCGFNNSGRYSKLSSVLTCLLPNIHIDILSLLSPRSHLWLRGNESTYVKVRKRLWCGLKGNRHMLGESLFSYSPLMLFVKNMGVWLGKVSGCILFIHKTVQTADLSTNASQRRWPTLGFVLNADGHRAFEIYSTKRYGPHAEPADKARDTTSYCNVSFTDACVMATGQRGCRHYWHNNGPLWAWSVHKLCRTCCIWNKRALITQITR